MWLEQIACTVQQLREAVCACRDLAAPKQVQGLKSRRITLISGGWRHTVAADDAGNLHAWGWNKVIAPCASLSKQLSLILPVLTCSQ